ncbi:MAG: hypothetical protein WCL32_02950 [Planctomycetota bacterium]
MHRSVTGVVALSLALGVLLHAAHAQEPESIGHLLHHVRDERGDWRQRSTPYTPHEGDMVFFNDHSVKWGILYKIVGSDAPYHVGLIFKKPDGVCAIAEAGPNDTLTCRVLELSPRLHGWEHTLLIRRCKKKLTAEQSTEMTNWAMAQDGKRYALGRLLLQATPVRCRGPLRRGYFGATYTDRDAYLCAELVIAGGTVGGIFDPQVHKANTIYPRDVVQDDIHDLSALYHEARVWLPRTLTP